jgi:putative Mg2+ transporter-C (MgtC) family protein
VTILASISQWDAQIHQWLSTGGTPIEQFAQLILAGVMGGLVGIEREIRGREAGFRTYLLVCLGSALVMAVSIQMAIHPWHAQTANEGVNINVDPARIAYGVMTGIGFLGAGVIVHQKGTVRGLTTAAGLWCVAAVGLAVGFGMYTVSTLATFLIISALSILDGFERVLPKLQYREITLRSTWRPGCVSDAIARFRSAGLRVADAYFDRDERDPSIVNIHLRISFLNRNTYHAFERKIEADPDYNLMAAEEV